MAWVCLLVRVGSRLMVAWRGGRGVIGCFVFLVSGKEELSDISVSGVKISLPWNKE
jgi:hypothetical protein